MQRTLGARARLPRRRRRVHGQARRRSSPIAERRDHGRLDRLPPTPARHRRNRSARTCSPPTAPRSGLGMRIVAARRRHAPRLEMTVRDDMLNGHDICHGGFITTLADSAFAFACNSRNELTVAAGLTRRLPRAGARAATCSPPTRSRSSRAGRTGVYDIVVTNQHGARVALVRGRSAQPRRSHRHAAGATEEPRMTSQRPAARRARADRARQPRRAARAAARAHAAGACSTPTTTSPHYRRAFDAKGVHPARPEGARRPGEVSVHGQERPARQLSVRHVRGAARARRAHPRVVGHDRQADRRRLHAARHRHLGRPGRALDPRRRRPAGRHGPRRLRLRPLHRRPRRALRRRARRLHRDPDVGRADREAGPADPAT